MKLLVPHECSYDLTADSTAKIQANTVVYQIKTEAIGRMTGKTTGLQ